MKKIKKKDEIRSEYKRKDLGVGVRGKYYEAYQESHNVVLLKPEVAKAFPTEEAVNEALMSLIRVAKTSMGLTKGST
jgi:outer membrane protein assembly factor BamD (BamD/ComL family)